MSELAETGGTFRVEVKATAGLNSNQWNAVLINDLRSWTATVDRAEYGTYVDNNTVAGYRLNVRVPADTPPEVFNLAISHPSGGAVTNRKAVGILRNFETNFYILHYTDIQVEGVEPTNMDTGQYNAKGSIREIYWHAPAVNLINPRFMFHTGDEKENVWGGEAEYELYIEALCSIKTPTFVTRGNNDSTTTTAVWRRQIGVETYSYTMGSFHISMKDYRENNFFTAFTNDYAASFTNSAIKYRLFGQHFNSGASQWLPPAGQYPDLMLVGHGHQNLTLQSSPYYVLETQAGFVKGAVGFFQFNKSAGDWSCSTLGNPWFQLMSSGAAAKITNSFSYANDGSQTTNLATIVNSIAHNFWDGRVRFLMQYRAQGYQVTGGEKLAEYPYNGNSNMAVVVKVNIAASDTTVVSIGAPNPDLDGDGMPDAWEVRYFPEGTNAAPTGHGDSDGMNNLQEYLAGTDPTNSASVLRITECASTATTNAFILHWASASNRWYSVDWATNLPGTFTPLTSGLPANPPLNVFTDDVHGAESRGFYRIGVTP
ncbi:hypothetical protein ACFLQU_01310 [Verrucomicrobiota bacterium]